MDVLWKGIIGGLVTALIVTASKRGSVLPGILPLAPTFAIIALLAVGAKGERGGFTTACLSGARTIPAYLVFLGTCYVLIHYVDYRLAILGGLAAWLVVALAIFLAPRFM
ncbi:GlpM family protein [Caballeronia concitans]|uniref:GlpM protein n=1 Tax=Caballeronia concitans TaxID=1777133 RepID=A0A658R0T0_9BURK|nr:GlpM family protein [Caballeronia concitans]KIG08108.1 GlpM family protein [Burkholderia sp. MR1]SAL36945.1 GlpM protein [Caballeronia concitans]